MELNGRGIHIKAEDIQRGIRQTRWPGRFQVVRDSALGSLRFPEAVFDVAHNPAGAWALRAALSEHYPDQPLTMAFGVLRDKAFAEIARILFPLAERVIATRAHNPRSAEPEEIRSAATATGTEVICEATVPAALQRAAVLAGGSGVVVVTGSIYVVGEAMAALGISP